MDYIVYLIFKITLNILKKHETVTDNPSIMIQVNKFLTPETMKLLGGTKDKNGESAPHLEIKDRTQCFCILF